MQYAKNIIPPQAIELEQAVLGALLIEANAVDDIAGLLTPDMFYNPNNNIIYASIIDLHSKSKQIDMLTIIDALQKKGKLEQIGGASYISELTNIVASSANIVTHAKIIIQQHIKRELIRISQESLTRSYDGITDAFECINIIEKNISNIINLNSTNSITTLSNSASSVLVESENIRHNNNPYIGVPSGFNEIDRITGGFRGTDLIILAARPAMGKTAMMCSLAYNAASQGYPIGVISLEMPSSQLSARIISITSNINLMKIRNAKYSDEEYNRLIHSVSEMENIPLFIDDSSSVSLLKIKSIIRKMNKLGCKMVIIDQLNHIHHNESNRSRNDEIGTISRTLKAEAKELNIPIILLHQLNRQVEARTDKKPQLSDLRDSGCLAGDTIIYCPDIKKNVRIEDLENKKDFHVLHTDYVKNEIKAAKKCFTTGIKDVYEMELISGQKIKATLNHKFLTQNGWKELSELENEKVAIPINFDNKELDISDAEISIIGHFLANGSALKGLPIRYAQNLLDNDLTEIVMKDAINACGGKIAPRYVDTILEKSKFRTIFFKPIFHLTHGKTSPMTDIFKRYGLFDKRAKEKFIPAEFYFLSKRQIAILLKSMYSGDGTVNYREHKGRKTLQVSYSSASEKLINGVQFLLQKIGIVSSITKYSNNKKQVWFCLSINAKSNKELFVKYIGFWNKRKNDILMDGWEKSKEISNGWSKYSFNEERTLCFIPVKSINYIGKEKVYDIEVDSIEHNFTANGMIVHNSIEQDADIVMFLHRPEYYKPDDVDLHDKAEVIFAKHRNGVVGTVPIGFRKECTKFYNLDNYEQLEQF